MFGNITCGRFQKRQLKTIPQNRPCETRSDFNKRELVGYSEVKKGSLGWESDHFNDSTTNPTW